MGLAQTATGASLHGSRIMGVADWRRLAVDAHVHLRGDVESCLMNAARNFAGAGDQVDAGVILLTESDGDDTFGDLCRGAAQVRVKPTGEGISLLSQLGDLPVLLVAGRQVITAERIEVLLIGTLDKPNDGIALDALLDQAEEEDVLAILPWGLGKWIGHRGKLVNNALGQYGGVLVGDIQARTRLMRVAPIRMTRATRRRVLDGTDPLPLPRESERVGSFGQILTTSLDPKAPGAALIAALRSDDVRLEPYGRRQSLFTMARLQWALRRGKREAIA